MYCSNGLSLLMCDCVPSLPQVSTSVRIKSKIGIKYPVNGYLGWFSTGFQITEVAMTSCSLLLTGTVVPSFSESCLYVNPVMFSPTTEWIPALTMFYYNRDHVLCIIKIRKLLVWCWASAITFWKPHLSVRKIISKLRIEQEITGFPSMYRRPCAVSGLSIDWGIWRLSRREVRF